MDSYIHREHSEQETSTHETERSYICLSAYEPRNTENNRPCDNNPNHVYRKWKFMIHAFSIALNELNNASARDGTMFEQF